VHRRTTTVILFTLLCLRLVVVIHLDHIVEAHHLQIIRIQIVLFFSDSAYYSHFGIANIVQSGNVAWILGLIHLEALHVRPPGLCPFWAIIQKDVLI
jgi:hypothetical protein